jgi:hypothetical protein
MTSDHVDRKAANLIRVAQFLVRQPEFAETCSLSQYGETVNVQRWFFEQETAAADMAAMSKRLRRDVAAKKQAVKKDSNDYQFSLTVEMDGFTVTLVASRESVCKKVDTGRTEEREIYDPNAPKITETVPVYEWECSPLLK